MVSLMNSVPQSERMDLMGKGKSFSISLIASTTSLAAFPSTARAQRNDGDVRTESCSGIALALELCTNGFENPVHRAGAHRVKFILH